MNRITARPAAQKGDLTIMERCDFASVTSILLRHIRQGTLYTQVSFIDDLFSSVFLHTGLKHHKPDKATINKWLSGTLKVTSDISGYYQNDHRQKDMAGDIEKKILPLINDPGLLVQDLQDLVIQDVDISEETKQHLCQGFPWRSDSEKAEFVKSLICFGMDRRLIKKTSRINELLATDQLSPSVANYIFDEGIPKPCRHFCGREQELNQLHELLIEDGKVFIHGIPGIGKSELAKAYARKHKKDYTNILYISYSGSLKRDITELPFADDRPTDMDKDRFRKHNRFLRTLKGDTLIIIDNFDTLPFDDNFLPVVLKYRCRILFTTRSLFPEYTGIELKEIEDREALFHLVSFFYPEAEKIRPLIEEILDVIHRHTMCAELMARLLAKSMLKPEEVLARLKKERASFSASDRISISKDGRPSRKTYYDHLEALFSLLRLTVIQIDILRSLSLAPLTGISARLFGSWMKLEDLNDLNELIDLGLIRELDEFKVSLHPLIREVIVGQLVPRISNCKVILKSIQAECIQHGAFLPYHAIMFQVVENAISTAVKDEERFYLQFLEDVFPYMDNYSYTEGMRKITAEMKDILEKGPVDAKDHALLLLYRARLETDSSASISYLQEALRLFPETDTSNAALVGNLHATIGEFYRLCHDNVSARQHMETAASIFRQFNLDGTHDFMTLYINLSSLLLQTGHPAECLQSLLQLEALMMQQNLYTVDYMLVQESLVYTYLSLDETQAAKKHYDKLIQLYAVYYENDPETAAAKKAALDAAFKQKQPRLR